MPEFESTTQRRLSILTLLNESKSVDVNVLSNTFGVSVVTVRKDLTYLEKKNLLLRSRGGAMLAPRSGIDIAIDERKKINLPQKKAIGLAASKLINNGDTIILDSGTTIMELARNLSSFTELTVITNAIDITSKLVEYNNINLIVPGGMLRKNSLSLVGVMAAQAFRNLRCDLFFFSADGVSVLEGLSTPNMEEAYLTNLIISNSKKSVALVDSSKFNRSGLITIAKLDKIQTIITDNGISADQLEQIKETGIEVIIV